MKYKTHLILMVVLLLGAGYAQQNQTNPNQENQTAKEDSPPKVVHRVSPIYPHQAKAKRIEGTVVLEVVIGKQGNVVKTRIISGDQIFADAALAAIKAWKFEPATSQGQPVERATQIRIKFQT